MAAYITGFGDGSSGTMVTTQLGPNLKMEVYDITDTDCVTTEVALTTHLEKLLYAEGWVDTATEAPIKSNTITGASICTGPFLNLLFEDVTAISDGVMHVLAVGY